MVPLSNNWFDTVLRVTYYIWLLVGLVYMTAHIYYKHVDHRPQ
jgi:hypothetical protein